MKPIITKFNDKTGDFEITIPVPFTLKDGIEYVDMVVADIPKYEDKKDYNVFDLIRENQELKKQLKIKHDGFMASVDEVCELAEENQKYKEVIDKLKNKLMEYFEVGKDCYFYVLTRDKSAFYYGTMSFDDFKEFSEEQVDDIIDFLKEVE